MSCSQNCENCGPIVGLYSIMASASVSPGGWGCLNGDPLPGDILAYHDYSFQGITNSQNNYNFYGFTNFEGGFGDSGYENITSMGKAESRTKMNIRPIVDQYGRYLEINVGSIETSYTNSSNGKKDGQSYGYLCNQQPYYSSYSRGQGTSLCRLVECDYSKCSNEPCGYWICNENCSFNSSDSGDTSPCSDPNGQYSDSYSSDICYFPPISCQLGEGCTQQDASDKCEAKTCKVSCSTVYFQKFPALIESDVYGAFYTTTIDSNTSIQESVGTKVTLAQAKGYSKSCVNTKIGIYQNNRDQDPCGTRCGGNKDDCWGGGFGFLIVGNSETSYYARAKVKVAVSKEAMEPYSNIGGKVYFYENSVPGCCGEGSPIIETSFSLGPSANFKNGTLCATDVYNFDNDQMQAYAGSTIVGCVKVTSVRIR